VTIVNFREDDATEKVTLSWTPGESEHADKMLLLATEKGLYVEIFWKVDEITGNRKIDGIVLNLRKDAIKPNFHM
jgi:hypothetical protein